LPQPSLRKDFSTKNYFFVSLRTSCPTINVGVLTGGSSGNATSDRGDCGSPWIVDNQVLGLHCGGSVVDVDNHCVRLNSITSRQ